MCVPEESRQEEENEGLKISMLLLSSKLALELPASVALSSLLLPKLAVRPIEASAHRLKETSQWAHNIEGLGPESGFVTCCYATAQSQAQCPHLNNGNGNNSNLHQQVSETRDNAHRHKQDCQ